MPQVLKDLMPYETFTRIPSDEEKCPICYEPHTPQSNVYYICKCNVNTVYWHKGCLDAYQQAICPSCGKSVEYTTLFTYFIENFLKNFLGKFLTLLEGGKGCSPQT